MAMMERYLYVADGDEDYIANTRKCLSELGETEFDGETELVYAVYELKGYVTASLPPVAVSPVRPKP